MKIRHLKIEGFRSLREVEWTPGDLNVVIGPNGTGKSNLLLALELLSESASRRLTQFVERVGGMDPLVWDGIVESLNFSVETSGLFSTDPEDYQFYTLNLHRIGYTSSFHIDQEILVYRKRVDDVSSKPAEISRVNLNAEVWNQSLEILEPVKGRIDESESLLSQLSGPMTDSKVIIALQRHLSELGIYQGFRTDPESPVRRAAITRRETRLSADGSNLVSVLHTLYSANRDFEEAVNAAMSVSFGEDFDRLVFPPDADGRVQLRIRWKSLKREQSTADLSDGILRFLYLLTVLANPAPPSLLAVDEPETGLHPAMLHVIAEYAANAALRTQVVITTHSAEFLDAITPFRPSVSVTTWEGGETKLQTADGKRLERWLDDYSLGRLYRSGELEFLGSRS